MRQLVKARGNGGSGSDISGNVEPVFNTLGLDRRNRERKNKVTQVISPAKIAAALSEHWSPRVLAELDDSYVKVAKLHGSFTWHCHDDEDELFLVLRGRLLIELEEASVELNEGDLYVVPKGVMHNPIAEEECLVLLIERKSTLHTGAEITGKTRSIEDQLRAL